MFERFFSHLYQSDFNFHATSQVKVSCHHPRKCGASGGKRRGVTEQQKGSDTPAPGFSMLSFLHMASAMNLL